MAQGADPGNLYDHVIWFRRRRHVGQVGKWPRRSGRDEGSGQPQVVIDALGVLVPPGQVGQGGNLPAAMTFTGTPARAQATNMALRTGSSAFWWRLSLEKSRPIRRLLALRSAPVTGGLSNFRSCSGVPGRIRTRDPLLRRQGSRSPLFLEPFSYKIRQNV